MGIIYCYTNLKNNKRYIGQTLNPESRYAAHKSAYKNPNNSEYDSLINRAFRKYGYENFKYEVLAKDIDDINILNELEIYYINFYKKYYKN